MSSCGKQKPVVVAIVFAAFLTGATVFAQTGGLTGKVIGDGGKPLAGYTIQLERTDIKWNSKTKTNKKGEYTYIGLTPGVYKITLLDPQGKRVYDMQEKVGIGDPVEADMNIQQAMAEQKKELEANPEYQKQQADIKQNASLKQVFDQGRALYLQKQYAQAAEVFEKALPLAKDKNVSIVMAELADTWSKAASVENNPDTKKQDQAKALDYFTKLTTVAPSDPGIHNNLGNLYSDMGKYTEAEAEFKKAAELDPTHAGTYYYNMGAIFVNRGQMDQAAEALKKATDLDPNNANAWYWYGSALLGKVKTKPDGTPDPVPGTVEAFQTYLKLQPNGPMAPQAQASIEALSTKQNLEYKKTKK